MVNRNTAAHLFYAAEIEVKFKDTRKVLREDRICALK